MEQKITYKVIIGLGNPGQKYYTTRHNIGFRVLDALVEKYQGKWVQKNEAEKATIIIREQSITAIKPQTFMNSSGRVFIPFLQQGITAQSLIVVHDELEKPFGSVTVKIGGSHKGHNGLKSIMEVCGPEFTRIRCGIGRPHHKDDVAAYVLMHFSENSEQVIAMIQQAIIEIEKLF